MNENEVGQVAKEFIGQTLAINGMRLHITETTATEWIGLIKKVKPDWIVKAPDKEIL